MEVSEDCTYCISEEPAQKLDSESSYAKRQRLSRSPELFTSCGESEDDTASSTACRGHFFFPSDDECEAFSDDAIFPPDASVVDDGNWDGNTRTTDRDCESSSVIYPSDVSELEGEEATANVEEADSIDFPSQRAVTVDGQSPNERERAATVLVATCCEKDCLLHLTAHDVIMTRRKLSSLRGTEQRQWLMDRLVENSHEVEKGKLETKYLVAGQEVCQLAWCKVTLISSKRVSSALKSASLGQVIAEHGNKGKKRMNTKSENAKAWMQRYFHLIGDRMPHNSQIHLPSWETQKDLYTRYAEDMTLQNIASTEVVCLSMFYKLWNGDFSYVVIPEVSLDCMCMHTFNMCMTCDLRITHQTGILAFCVMEHLFHYVQQNRFAKCDICVKIKVERRDCLDKKKQSDLSGRLQDHLKMVE